MHELFSDDHLVTLNRASTVAGLLAGLAHEVNNALLVISGTAELLEERPDLPEAVTKGMVRIRSQCARAAGVISDVLAFAKADPQVRGRVNLREAAAAGLALRSWKMGRAGLKVAFTAPEDRAFIVLGNRVLLQQAVLNLLGNAEQALAGVPGGLIRVELTEEQGRGVLRVADSGAGVPADQRTRVFEPFVTTRPGGEFTGLGLPAARRIAEMHGGTLDLEDAPAGGSFVLNLPLA
jgi:signal transduction histidine kinase